MFLEVIFTLFVVAICF